MTRTAAIATSIKGQTKRAASDEAEKPKETMRDFVEQIVVAIILAMLIRAFDAEAFVIPTGSMAPTLMGRHKEVYCPQCGYLYAINASDENDSFVGGKQDDAARHLDSLVKEAKEAGSIPDERVRSQVANKLAAAQRAVEQTKQIGICVNCRYRTVVEDTPSFKGDRILVMKFPYELPFLPGSSGPSRWDVVVFHCPEKPETNYIKRLVGLPGEDLRISHGDVHTRKGGTNDPFEIRRKPLIHQRAMQILVNDDTLRPSALKGKPEWLRWKSGEGWKAEENQTYTVAAPADPQGWSELRYRHVFPDPEQWAAIEANQPVPRGPRPTLITDFYSYNTNFSQSNSSYYDAWLQRNEGYLQPDWVGDLTVSCRTNVASFEAGGKLKLELVEAGVSNRCEVDLLTGVATLYHGEAKLGEAGTGLGGIGVHDIEFANVDDRLTLWVDGGTPFEAGLAYDDGPNAPHVPTVRDLDPVGVAFRGAKATVSDLALKRDIYYTKDPSNPDHRINGVHESLDRDDSSEFGRVVKMNDFLSDPEKFAVLKDLTSHDPYIIRDDHFMMMGDNSPRSSDSRAWGTSDIWRSEDRYAWEVPRSLLIGKAFFVYWPHGKPFGPDVRVNQNFRIPFRPYVERMKWIR